MVINIVTLLSGDPIQKNFYSSIGNSDKYSGLVISLLNVQTGRNVTEGGSILRGDNRDLAQHGEEIWRVDEPKTIDNDLNGGKQILGNVYKMCITLSFASFGNQQPSDTQESLDKARSSRTGPVGIYFMYCSALIFLLSIAHQ